MQPAPLIYINGYPGSGKRTISRHLPSLLPANPVLVDNDTANNDCGRSHPDSVINDKADRQRTHTKYIEAQDMKQRIVIFTGCTTSKEGDREAALEYAKAAAKTERAFIPILLQIGLEENIRRVGVKERKVGANMKTTDPESIAETSRKFELMRFGVEKELVLDVTELSPEEAAGKIARWVWWVGEFMCWDDNEDCIEGEAP